MSSPPSSPVSCGGLRATPGGLCSALSRRVSHRWDELRAVALQELERPLRYHVRFEFSDGRMVVATVARKLGRRDHPQRLAEVLRHACAGAPAGASLPGPVRELAAWGTREQGARLAAEPAASRSAAAWLDLARHQRAVLDRRSAVASVEAAFMLCPGDAHVLKAHAGTLAWAGARADRIAHAAESWLRRYPENDDALRFSLLNDLAAGAPPAAERAATWLEQHPDDRDVTQALASHFVARGDAASAAEVWARRAQRAASPADAREAEVRERVARDQADHNARLRSLGRKPAWGFAFAFAPLFFLAGLATWQGARFLSDSVDIPAGGREAERQKIRDDMARREREVTEATGLVFGAPADIEARAEAGEPAAAYTLAEWLQAGTAGLPVDPVRSLAYLEIAAAGDHRQALFQLAQRLDEGDGVTADPARALALYERAANQGSLRAAGIVGHRYADGTGTAKDPFKALRFLRQAADGGDLQAMTRLGWALERGEGSPTDLASALHYYRLAAERENPWAQERLVRLLNQTGSPHYAPDEAWLWTERGAHNGSQPLQLTFARLVMSGREATAQNRARAAHWIRTAHAAQSPEAAYLWGRALWAGWQVDQDFEAAAGTFESEHGLKHPPSLEYLARMYAFGLGVPRDQFRARALRDDFAASNPPSHLLDELDRLLAATSQPLAEAPPGGRRPQRSLWRALPEYPPDLQRRRIEGSVTVRFSLDHHGFTRDLHVLETTHPDFVAPALAAVRQWRFDPAWDNGERRHETQEAPVLFSLASPAKK